MENNEFEKPKKESPVPGDGTAEELDEKTSSIESYKGIIDGLSKLVSMNENSVQGKESE